MTLCVTGATGFIGCRVVRLLLQRGHHLHLLVRTPTKLDTDARSQSTVFVGDICDRHIVREALHGCSAVVHLAAHARAWSAHPSCFDRVNVNGTRTVAEEALAQSVARFVYASSCSALRIDESHVNDESTVALDDDAPTHYGRSKARAERVVQQCASRGLPVLTVYPTRVFGSGTFDDSNAAGRVLHEYAYGVMRVFVDRARQTGNWVHVDDVARGILLALERGCPGERYFLGGENRSLSDVLDMVDGITGVQRRRFSISARTARGLAVLEETRARIFHSRPFITRGWLTTLLREESYSISKAQRALGYDPQPLDRALRKTIQAHATH